MIEDFRSSQQKLYDYHSRIQSRSTTVPPDHLQVVADLLSEMRGWEANVKSGRMHVQQLQSLLERSRLILSKNENATKSTHCEMPPNISVGKQWNHQRHSMNHATRALGEPPEVGTNVDKTRNMITRLIWPMALIAKSIAASITVNKEKIEELRETMPINLFFVDGKKDRELETRLLGLRKKGIQMRTTAVEQCQIEYSWIQITAIQFGFFLKRHAIMPYNDVIVDYIDMLIDQEKLLIQRGGKTIALDTLEKYRTEYNQKVKVINNAVDGGNESVQVDDEGIRRLVDFLFCLPHFGENLRAILTNGERAAESACREVSRTVSVGDYWNRQYHFQRHALGASAELSEVRSTVNMNKTRNTIIRLLWLMALIVHPIAARVFSCEERIKKLQDPEYIKSKSDHLRRRRDTEIAIQKKVEEHIQLEEKAIQMEIKEHQLAYNQIQSTAIQFGFFLKHHAITPCYHVDPTVDYIDMLIDQEKLLIQRGDSKNEALNVLEKYRIEYIQQVEVINNTVDADEESTLSDNQGIWQAIDSLFSLPYFGENLRAILSNNE